MNDKEQLARALMQAYLGSDYENEPLSDADLMLRDSVESALNERGFSIVATDEIEELKAQVNCLRKALKILDRNSKAREALEATPEQCLAEVKAKAIEEMIAEFNKTRFLGTSLTKLVSDYVTQLREQAK